MKVLMASLNSDFIYSKNLIAGILCLGSQDKDKGQQSGPGLCQ